MADNSALLKKQRTRKTVKVNFRSWCYIFPFVLLFLYGFAPLFYGLVISFYSKFPIKSTTAYVPKFTLNNFKALFGYGARWETYGKPFWKTLGYTFAFDVVAVPCLIIIPLFLAYLINLEPKGYKIFRAIIYLPSVISGTIMGAIFVYLFNDSAYGFFNGLFGTEIKFIGTWWSRWGIILFASVWWQEGTNFLIFSAALKNVDKSLYEASSIDGCNRWQQFLKVTLPGIRKQMILCIFTTVLGYLILYSQPALIKNLGEGGPDTPMMIIQEGLGVEMDHSLGMAGFFTAASWMLALVSIIISIIQVRIFAGRKGGSTHEKQFNEYFKIEEKQA